MENSKMLSLLVEAVEAGGAQFDEAGFEGFGERGFGMAGLAADLAADLTRGGRAWLRLRGAGSAWRTGKSALSRVPSPSASVASAISSMESRLTRPSQWTQWTVPQRA